MITIHISLLFIWRGNNDMTNTGTTTLTDWNLQERLYKYSKKLKRKGREDEYFKEQKFLKLACALTWHFLEKLRILWIPIFKFGVRIIFQYSSRIKKIFRKLFIILRSFSQRILSVIDEPNFLSIIYAGEDQNVFMKKIYSY